MSRLTFIVAATTSGGIGQNGQLPWRLPKEMKHFVRVTTFAPENMQNVVVMGRTTWESIPAKFRPLPNRFNIVVSRQHDYDLQCPNTNARLAHSLDEALNSNDVHRTFIIGGSKIYNDTLSLASTSSAYVDRILLTRILSPDFEECDVFLPDELRETGLKNAWTKAAHDQFVEWAGVEVPEGVQEEKGVKYEFQMWTRN
ncbi:dihydrofolate reductase [Flagelloscypha sp. PMI_526]|nr:dihydrofolate reductase [Flagelloscypha sp. PMI_526]